MPQSRCCAVNSVRMRNGHFRTAAAPSSSRRKSRLAAVKAAGLGDFHWHDLRHTWASWHVQNGTPLAVLQELGGWRDLKMVLRYAHLAPGHLAPYAGNSGLAKPQDVEIDQAQNRTHDVRIAEDEEDEILLEMNGVADGTRTHDNRNHNPGLYQLSYSHRGISAPSARRILNRTSHDRRHQQDWHARQDSNLLPPA